MNEKHLLYQIGELDHRFLAAAEYPQKRPFITRLVRYGSVAACFCLVAVLGVGIWHMQNAPEPAMSSSSAQTASEYLSESGTDVKIPPQGIPLSAFAASPVDPDSDAFGEDELRHVDIILQGSRLYVQLSAEECAALNIGAVLQPTDFGASLGNITELAPHAPILSSPCSQEPNLANCTVHAYTPTNCEAVMIVQGNGHCSLFRFAGFTEEGHDFHEMYHIFGVNTADDIRRVDYTVNKPKGAIIAICDEGTVKDRAKLQAFYDITTGLIPFVREQGTSGDPDWLTAAFAAYNRSSEENRISIAANIVLHNGLSMECSYLPTLGTGYIDGYYFLSEAENAVMKEMFQP